MAPEPKEKGGVSIWERIKPTSARVAIVAVFLAVVTGELAALATMALGQSRWAFGVVAVISGGYLWSKQLATEAIGTGLYISAILLLLTPILSYIPTMLGIPADPEAPMRIWTILGFVIWGVLFTLVAIVIAAFGRYFKNRAAISELHGRRFPF